MKRKTILAMQFENNLFGGVAAITGAAKRRVLDAWRGALYRLDASRREQIAFKAIPYFAWDNRAPGEMLMWMREM